MSRWAQWQTSRPFGILWWAVLPLAAIGTYSRSLEKAFAMPMPGALWRWGTVFSAGPTGVGRKNDFFGTLDAGRAIALGPGTLEQAEGPFMPRFLCAVGRCSF